jgi:glutaredoxin-dependent peroxiredoxin
MAVKVGDKAPDFTLADASITKKSLKDFAGKKTILAFIPGAFTGVCTKELCTFRDSLTNFSGLNAQVVAISVDSPFANKAFSNANNLTFPVLTDYSRKVSEQYAGLIHNFAGLEGYSASNRAVFIVDKDGIIRYSWIGENPGIEPPYDEINKALATIQ